MQTQLSTILVNCRYLDIVTFFRGSIKPKRGILGYRIALSTFDNGYLLGNSHLYSIATGRGSTALGGVFKTFSDFRSDGLI